MAVPFSKANFVWRVILFVNDFGVVATLQIAVSTDRIPSCIQTDLFSVNEVAIKSFIVQLHKQLCLCEYPIHFMAAVLTAPIQPVLTSPSSNVALRGLKNHEATPRQDNGNVHRAAAKIIVSKSRAARGSVCNILLSRD